MELRLLAADEWQQLREVRLLALKDSPTAFLADYDREEALEEQDWRLRFVGSQWFTAWKDNRIIGLARVLTVDDRPADERHIESVWVDPEYRQMGVLRNLLRYVVEQAPAVNDWMLWVLDDNDQALEVYKRLGFSEIDDRQALTDGSGRDEIHLRYRSRRRSRTASTLLARTGRVLRIR
ncbi:GNAT family N-acetyltransferase [Kribbella sp. NPDC051587]|uniref:GNAT family N-acetyltransferase n=1 Tax=Kribbella sp. NPDC051587 TaxID=3364119 RepID=UPI003792959E